jgi:hypothetical protein
MHSGLNSLVVNAVQLPHNVGAQPNSPMSNGASMMPYTTLPPMHSYRGAITSTSGTAPPSRHQLAPLASVPASSGTRAFDPTDNRFLRRFYLMCITNNKKQPKKNLYFRLLHSDVVVTEHGRERESSGGRHAARRHEQRTDDEQQRDRFDLDLEWSLRDDFEVKRLRPRIIGIESTFSIRFLQLDVGDVCERVTAANHIHRCLR